MFALAIRLVDRIHLTGSLIFQRWIFILEGIATVIVAVASFWMLHDYPDTAKFLTEDERAFIVERLKLDNDGCSQAYKNKFIKDAFLDWKVWVVSRWRRSATRREGHLIDRPLPNDYSLPSCFKGLSCPCMRSLSSVLLSRPIWDTPQPRLSW